MPSIDLPTITSTQLNLKFWLVWHYGRNQYGIICEGPMGLEPLENHTWSYHVKLNDEGNMVVDVPKSHICGQEAFQGAKDKTELCSLMDIEDVGRLCRQLHSHGKYYHTTPQLIINKPPRVSSVVVNYTNKEE